MKQTLLLIIAVGMVGCKDGETQKPLYEHNEWLPSVKYNPDSSVRMTIDGHWCIYDSCPHFTPSGYYIGTTEYHLLGHRGPCPPIESDSCPHIVRDTLPKGKFKLIGGGDASAYLLAVDSLGNIIEDTVPSQ